MDTIICPCGNKIDVFPWLVGRKKYCSKLCFYKYRKRPSGLSYNLKVKNPTWFDKGFKPWNKGTKGICKSNSGSIKLKQHLSQKTEFKSGHISWNKNKEFLLIRDKNHKNWKGDEVGYDALHSWVKRRLGKAKKCIKCNSTNNIHWANKSKKYKRKINDWLPLCSVCHRRFDGITKLSKKQVNIIRSRYKNGEIRKNIAVDFGVSVSTITNVINHRIKYYG